MIGHALLLALALGTGDSTALVVDSIALSPDTVAVDWGDVPVLRATCFNVHPGNVVACKGGVRWSVGDTAVAGPILTTDTLAYPIPKAMGTTWIYVRTLTGAAVDSTKYVVVTGPPAPEPPLPPISPESVFVAASLDTLEIDSAASGTVIGRTYRNSALTETTIGRALTVSTTNAAVASFTPTAGVSPLSVAVTGTVSGTAKLIFTSPIPGKPDTTVVIVHPVSGPPDTTSTPPPTIPCPGGSIAVLAGQDWQVAVNMASSSAVLCAKAGVHRGVTVSPKTGQTIRAETGAIFSGAKVLTGWTASGGRWYVDGQTQQNTAHDNNNCAPAYPRCAYPEQLWVDGELLRHVASQAAVASATWYFDYDANRIWIGVNPSGKVVETSVTPQAVTGSGTNVKLAQLTIEKYATGSGRGTIDAKAG